MSTFTSLKFTGKTGRRFGAELRQRVNAYFRENNLSEKGNWKMALKAVMMPGLYLAPFVLVLTVSMPFWFMMILAVISGAGLAFTGMTVMHDAAHGSLSSRNWLNQLFANVMHVLGGSTATWKVQHNVLHHTYTNIPGYDEDLEGPSFLRMSAKAPLRRIHRFQHWYALFLYSFLTLSKVVGDIPQLLRYGRMGLVQKIGSATTREMVKLTLVKVIYFAVVITLPILFTDFPWWQLLLAFLAMHMTAGLIMATVFQLAHVVEETDQYSAPESNDMETEWAVHQLRTTADFSPRSPIVRWFTGGLNYQIEHHLFPNICHVHYRKIAPIVEETAKEFGLPYYRKRTFWAALWSHLKMMRNLGRRPAMG